MIEWCAVALVGAASGAVWCWLERSLQRDCRRVLEQRSQSLALLTELEPQ